MAVPGVKSHVERQETERSKSIIQLGNNKTTSVHSTMPKRGKPKSNPSVGQRPHVRNPYAAVNSMRSEHMHNKGYSKADSLVLKQSRNNEIGPEIIMKHDVPTLMSDSTGVLGVEFGSGPSGGQAYIGRTNVAVQTSTSGTGWLLIRWNNTGLAGGGFAASGTATTPGSWCDMLYTSTGYTGTSFAPSLYNLALGNTGVAGASSTPQAPMSCANVVQFAEGWNCWATVGQKISLVANRTAVLDRNGTIYCVHIPGSLSDFSEASLQTMLKASAYDAADLTSDSHFSTRRPTLGLGQWTTLRDGTAAHPFGNAAGSMNKNEGFPGWTLIYIQDGGGAGQGKYIFEVETACVYGGLQVPPTIPICYDYAAYARVACARKHATRGSNTVNETNASKVGREVHVQLEKASAMYTPGHVFDGIIDSGSKILIRALKSFFG